MVALNFNLKPLISLALIVLLVTPLGIGQKDTQNIQQTNKSIIAQMEGYDLLILAPDEFMDPLQPLVEHKNQVGMKAKLVGLSTVYDEMFWHGRDEPEKIKYFIKQAYENWDITFVMLVGDFRKMPVRYVNNQDVLQGFYEPEFISELYYADIVDSTGAFSSWDTDNDGIYGEWIDDGVATSAEDKNIDLYPDVYVGRLACRNNLEVKTMVDKIITYETETYGSEWFNRIVVCGGDTYLESENPDWVGSEGERNNMKVLENMTGFDQVKLWTSDGSFTGVSDIIQAFNDGAGFVYFDGHANPYHWSTHPPNEDTWVNGLSVTTMSFLNNKEKLPVVVVGGCHNLQFDVHLGKIAEDPWYLYTWIPECWGWKLTRKIGGGSIATIGCTGLGMTSEDKFDGEPGAGDYLEPTFFYEYGMNHTRYLGQCWGNAITDYLNRFPVDWNTPAARNDAIDTKTVQQWTLMGDPSLLLGGYS